MDSTFFQKRKGKNSKSILKKRNSLKKKRNSRMSMSFSKLSCNMELQYIAVTLTSDRYLRKTPSHAQHIYHLFSIFLSFQVVLHYQFSIYVP